MDKEVTSTSYLLPVVWLLFHCVVVVQSDIRVRGEHFPFRSFYATYSTAVQKECSADFLYIYIYTHQCIYICIHTLRPAVYIYIYIIHVLYLYTDMTHIHTYIYIFYIIYTLHGREFS